MMPTYSGMRNSCIYQPLPHLLCCSALTWTLGRLWGFQRRLGRELRPEGATSCCKRTKISTLCSLLCKAGVNVLSTDMCSSGGHCLEVNRADSVHEQRCELSQPHARQIFYLSSVSSPGLRRCVSSVFGGETENKENCLRWGSVAGN